MPDLLLERIAGTGAGTRGQARFIVFEGLDGSGKTEQLRRLSEHLRRLNQPHIVTREPSDKPVGRLIRQVMENAFSLENETLALLFAADRYQHAAAEIIPALNHNSHVLCDRYYYSNFAYQGQGQDDEASFSRLAAYNQRVFACLKPDLVLFLDVPPEECIRRIRERQSTAHYYENVAKLNRVRDCYLETFDRLKETDPVAVIDGMRTAELVWESVWALLKERLVL